jgi:hypothetical protein
MLSDTLENSIEIKANKDEVANLKKKIENLNNFVHNHRGRDDEDNNNNFKNIDFNNFVDNSIFNEFKNTIKIYHNNTEKRCEEMERKIDDFNSLIENKLDKNDYKIKEDNIKNKIEELKISSLKKFCEKSEAYKQFKFLEIKIKTLEDKEKNKEKGENWLIAKKPVNGFSCASCESYIGEIKDNIQNINWKKFGKDQNSDQQKTYRVNLYNIFNLYNYKI